MRTIGFVIFSQGWGGLEINVLKLAKNLLNRGWNIELFVQENSRIAKESQDSGLTCHFVKDHAKYFAVRDGYSFSRLVRKMKIRDLWFFDNRDLDFGFFVKCFYPKARMVYQQQMQVGISKRDLIHTLRYKAIDYWITPLEKLKSELLINTRIPASKIKVIHLGVDAKRFITAKYTRAEARNKLDISENAVILGILGRIDPLKGQLFLMEAVSMLRNDFPDLQLLMMGERTINSPSSEAYYQEMMQYIELHKLHHCIHFRSFTKDVNLFYNAIDVFAMASKGETFGMVTVESLMSGVPVIGTNSSGTPEILQFGEFGMLYTWNDLKDFCEKLSWMLNHPEETKKTAESARKIILDKYSTDRECELMENEILRKASYE